MAIETVNKYKSLESENLQFIETDDVIPLLQAADVMLCDTSSILIMYLLQRRPVVTFNNQTKNSCLLNITDINEIESSLDHALSYPVDLISKIEHYCSLIHPYIDGESSGRVIHETNKLIENGIGNLNKKPVNFVRQFKLRKKLHYWKY